MPHPNDTPTPSSGPTAHSDFHSPGVTVGADTFRLLFERSTDPILLFDPSTGRFIDANQAAVQLLRSETKDRLLNFRPADWSPERQPDGRMSEAASAEFSAQAVRLGGIRFEWLARRADGIDLPLEIVATAIEIQGRTVLTVVARDVTERKASEAALRESRELLASIADNIYEGIYRSDAQHILTFVNRSYLRMFRYGSLAELQAVPRESLYADPSIRPRLLARLASEGGFDQEEIEYVRGDGTRFWGLSSAHALRDPKSGTVVYHVGAIADITESRRVADEIRQLNATLELRIAQRTAALTESEASLRTLIDHAPEAIVVYDADTGCFLSGNQNVLRLFGVSTDQLVRMTPLDVSPVRQPDGRLSADAARSYIASALAGESPVFEWVHTHSTGKAIPCEIRLVRLPAQGLRLVRGSITDNSERKQRERIQNSTYLISEAVHAADDLDELYQRIHEVVAELMPARNFFIALYSSETGLITFPYFRDEYGDDSPAPRSIDTGLTGAVLQAGQPLLMDAAAAERGRQPDGRIRVQGFENVRYYESGRPAAIWLGVPLRSQSGTFGAMVVQDYRNPEAYGEAEKQVLAYIGIQTALAIERKRSQQALFAALERERELGVLKSNFVSMVSHEFRTPLGIIMSSAGILEKYYDRIDPQERKDQLASIQRSTRRMGDLMEEVLLLARLDAGRIGFDPQPVDLPTLCRTIADDVAAVTLGHCPIFVLVGLPDEHFVVKADERLLRNIITNLLTNAVKYSDAGSPVDFTVNRDGDSVVFVIRDRGIGIPEADQPWLFQAFQRGRNVGSRAGTGLGLVIVQRCLELHGGRIDVESRPAQGTVMTVRLPVFRANPV